MTYEWLPSTVNFMDARKGKEGRAKGLLEGRADMVKNLLTVGTPIEYIIKATGWSESKILQLQQKSHRQ